MMFWRQSLAIARKDILAELRSKETVVSVLVFALMVVIIFNFAFGTSPETVALVAPGILWVTFSFAGVLSLNRAFVAEKEEGCLEGLMACPMPREVIYLGKMLASLLFMLAVEVVVLPAFVLLFNTAAVSPPLMLVTLLATLGFAAVGTLFAALAVNTRAREIVLPILFLPVVVPLVIAAVKASALALSGAAWSDMASWLQIILAFDAIFLVVPFFVFSPLVEE